MSDGSEEEEEEEREMDLDMDVGFERFYITFPHDFFLCSPFVAYIILEHLCMECAI